MKLVEYTALRENTNRNMVVVGRYTTPNEVFEFSGAGEMGLVRTSLGKRMGRQGTTSF